MSERRELETGWRWRMAERFLPAGFRRRYGADLLDAHVRRVGGRERAHGFGFWAAVWWDAFATGMQVRWDGEDGGRERWNVVEIVRQELQLSARRAVRQPGFTAAVALTLGLGIGANVMMFGILDRLLLSAPPGIDGSDRIRQIWVYGKSPFSQGQSYQGALSYPDLENFRDVGSFEHVAGRGPSDLTLGVAGASRRVRVEYASGSYFELLGVHPQMGRLFGVSDDVAGVEPTAVLSHDFWQREYGGDPGIVGRVLDLGKGRYTVIGVAPRDFRGVELKPIDVWIPLMTAGVIQQGNQWQTAWSWYWFGGIVRLAEGVTPEMAEAEATSRYRTARAKLRNADPDARVVLTSLVPGRGPEPSAEARVSGALGAVAFLVLLIACANVTNLLLARGIQRRRMHAVQSALGMSRRRLVVQMAAEAFVFSVLGGALAVLLSRLAGPQLIGVLLPDAAGVVLAGGRSVGVTTLLVTICVVLVGMLPTWRASRVDGIEAMRARGTTRGISTVRRVLLATQAALSIILLVGAGLFFRSLNRATRLDLGFSPDVITVSAELASGTSFGGDLAPAVYALLERLESNPSIESAAVASLPPWSGIWALELDVPGPDSIPVGPTGPAFVGAGADYFRTLGMTIIRGRPLDAADDAPNARPVTVVNESMARAVWPGRDAIGECLIVGKEGEAPCTEVVGIVSDNLPSLTATEAMQTYFLTPHHPGIGFVAAQWILIRPRGEPATVAAAVREAARTAVPEIRYVDVGLMSDRVRKQLVSWRLGATLLGMFGLLALLVAGAGFYSVVSFDVAQRSFELSVRKALGAPGRRLLMTVMGRALFVTAAGTAIGLVGALAMSRLVQSMLFQVPASDPLVYLTAFVTLTLAALLAGVAPAMRALRQDPARALREEV